MEHSSKINLKYLNKNDFQLFPPTLQESIKNIIFKEGYLSAVVNNRKTSSGGANYMGDLFEIDVKGETLNGNKELHLFVKHNVARAAAEGFASMSEIHSCEIFFYQELTKIFIELQEKANVPVNERYNVPTCYQANSEAIILENLAVQNFKIPSRMDVFPLKFAELSIQQLAKLHALSFVLQKERPEYYETKLKMKKYPMSWNEEFKLGAINMINITLANIDSEKHKNMIIISKDILLEKFVKYTGMVPHDVDTVNCLCHGDYRNGNILMQLIDGKVTKIIPVDYQTMYHGCPVNDLIYLIYTGSDSKFRKEHMQDLKDMYYNNLQDYLKYFKIDVEEVYPRKEFEKVFKKRLDYGLILMIMWGPLMFVQEQDAPDLAEIKMYDIKIKPDEKFVERVMTTLAEFEGYGYFDNLFN